MSVGLLIITHNNIGAEMHRIATALLGRCPLPCEILSIPMDTDIDQEITKSRSLVSELNQGHGVLVLTDMFGATPSNLANRLCTLPDVRVIAGLNLPMLIRVFNYADLSLSRLTDKAVSGGRDGVLLCETGKNTQHATQDSTNS